MRLSPKPLAVCEWCQSGYPAESLREMTLVEIAGGNSDFSDALRRFCKKALCILNPPRQQVLSGRHPQNTAKPVIELGARKLCHGGHIRHRYVCGEMLIDVIQDRTQLVKELRLLIGRFDRIHHSGDPNDFPVGIEQWRLCRDKPPRCSADVRNEPNLIGNRFSPLHHAAIFSVIGLRQRGRLKLAVSLSQQVFLVVEAEYPGQRGLIDADVSMICILCEKVGRGQVFKQTNHVLRIGVQGKERIPKGSCFLTYLIDHRQIVPKLLEPVQDATHVPTYLVHIWGARTGIRCAEPRTVASRHCFHPDFLDMSPLTYEYPHTLDI